MAWSSLPEPVLANIFSMLSVPDLLSVSQVNINWFENLKNPHIWKHIYFVIQPWFNEDYTSKALQLVDVYYKYFTSVKIIFPQEEFRTSLDSVVHNVVVILLQKLYNNTKISELHFFEFYHYCEAITIRLGNGEDEVKMAAFKKELLTSLIKILSQNKLKVFKMDFSYWLPKDGLILLDVLIQNSALCLEILDICDFFEDGDKFNLKLNTLLSPFCNLKQLTVRYMDLSDEIIFSLKANCQKLEKLNLYEEFHTIALAGTPFVSRRCWETLFQSNLKLKIGFKVILCIPLVKADIMSFIPPEFVLTSFSITFEFFKTRETLRQHHYDEILRYIFQQFEHTIEDLSIRVRGKTFPSIIIFEFLQKRRAIKNLFLKGENIFSLLRNIWSLHEESKLYICNMHIVLYVVDETDKMITKTIINEFWLMLEKLPGHRISVCKMEKGIGFIKKIKNTPAFKLNVDSLTNF